MIPLLKSLIHIFTNPLYLLILSVLGIAWSHFKAKSRGTTFFIIVALLTLLGTATPWIPNAMMDQLESQYSQLRDVSQLGVDSPDIMVLGSSHIVDPDLLSKDYLSAPGAFRLMEGLRILELFPGSKLVVSGYGNRSSKSHADILREVALSQGVDAKDIVVLSKPTNTAEEAELYNDRSPKDHRLILVTSAAHMPRAMKIFQNRGLDPIAAPTDFRHKVDPNFVSRGFNLSPHYMRNFHLAMHEYLGLLWENWSRKNRLKKNE